MAIKAVVIGVNYKKSPRYRLYGCASDAQNVKNKLKADGITDIKVLSDDLDNAMQPTAANITSALADAVESAKPGDILFVHYSGHGTEIRDFNNEEKDGKDSAIVAGDLKNIIDDKIKAILANTKGVKVVGLFDCCNSGTIADLPYSTEQVTETSQLKNQNFSEMVFVTGCLDPKTSAEIQTVNGAGGALTTAWITKYGHDHGSIEFINACLGDKESKKAVGEKLNKWMRANNLEQVVNVNYGGTSKIAAAPVTVAPVQDQTTSFNFLLEQFHRLEQQIASVLPFKSLEEPSSKSKPFIHSRPLPKSNLRSSHSKTKEPKPELGKRDTKERTSDSRHSKKRLTIN